jgi:hypothetical protein
VITSIEIDGEAKRPTKPRLIATGSTSEEMRVWKWRADSSFFLEFQSRQRERHHTMVQGSTFHKWRVPSQFVTGPSLGLAGSSSLLGIDPRGDTLIQHVKRECSSIQNLVVKGADVVLASKLSLRALAQLQNFKLT